MTADPAREFPTASNGRPAYHPEGEYLAVTMHGGTVRLLDPETHEILADLTPLVPGPITALRVSRDGTRIAIATGNRDIMVWHIPRLRAELAEIGLDWE